MWDGREFAQAVLAFAGGIFFCLFVIVLLSADRLPSWCTEEEARCLRDWLSALSGWAATIAAGVTGGLIWRQFVEQRKQTSFLLGDALPTIDAIQHMRSPAEVVVRLVNWNRRPVIVKGVSLDCEGFETGLKKSNLYDRERPKEKFVKRQLHDGALIPSIAMHGWKDRSEGPAEVRLDLIARQPGPQSVEVTDWQGRQVSVRIAIAGDDEFETTLTCPIARSR
ncbi:MAG: hypothetical protein K5872_01470 [Rhizobiaceae bacterium]|nr:hypothetical protein [Rhizobiaceae bacterium]MCV0404876.1 hypothetical protein [Rhizobiaceae bacterium]